MARELPDIFASVLGVLDALPEDAQPAMGSALERQAAKNYECWAEQADVPSLAAGLRLCAARERTVADIVDSAFPPQPSSAEPLREAAEALARAPDPFAGYGLEDCLRMQAAAERQGAARWRELATQCADAAMQRDLEICAKLEEESAAFIESYLGRP